MTFYPTYLKKIEDRRSDGKILLILIAFLIFMAINTIITYRIAWENKGHYDEINCRKARGE